MVLLPIGIIFDRLAIDLRIRHSVFGSYEGREKCKLVVPAFSRSAIAAAVVILKSLSPNRLQHVTTKTGLTEMAIDRANSALAANEALQLISTHIGTSHTLLNLHIRSPSRPNGLVPVSMRYSESYSRILGNLQKGPCFVP